MKLRTTVSIVCLTLLAAVYANAGDVRDAIRSGDGFGRFVPGPVFSWERNFSLDRVTVQELVLSGSLKSSSSGLAVSMGAYNRGSAGFDVPPVATTLVRSIPSLWRVQIPTAEDADAIDVTYEVEGANGHRNSLSNEMCEDSEISVTAQPLAPIVTDYGHGSTTIEGGVVLYLDIANARSAGRYSGTVTVAIHHL